MHVGFVVREVLLLLAAAAAGAVNSVAGGGTLITFPTLIWLGLGSIQANATSTVGILPGTLGAAWGYRREVQEVRFWLIQPIMRRIQRSDRISPSPSRADHRRATQ